MKGKKERRKGGRDLSIYSMAIVSYIYSLLFALNHEKKSVEAVNVLTGGEARNTLILLRDSLLPCQPGVGKVQPSVRLM